MGQHLKENYLNMNIYTQLIILNNDAEELDTYTNQ